jgi:hypothetical protein
LRKEVSMRELPGTSVGGLRSRELLPELS